VTAVTPPRVPGMSTEGKCFFYLSSSIMSVLRSLIFCCYVILSSRIIIIVLSALEVGLQNTNFDVNQKISATVFLGYLRDIWRYIRFLLISAINFYYVFNKLIILVPDPHLKLIIFVTGPPHKIPFNRYLPIFNH
jgi:hypothetical protein